MSMIRILIKRKFTLLSYVLLIMLFVLISIIQKWLFITNYLHNVHIYVNKETVENARMIISTKFMFHRNPNINHNIPWHIQYIYIYVF